jgi:hypothetical protein
MPIDASIYEQVKPPPSPLSQLTDVAKLREAQAQAQYVQSEAQKNQQAAAANAALNHAMSNALNPDGSINEDKLSQGMANTPAASKWPDVQENLAKVRKAKQDAAQAETDHVASLAAAADSAGDDPEDKAGVLLAGIASGVKDGSIQRDHGVAILQGMIGPDGKLNPAWVTRTLATMRAASQKQTEVDNATRTSKATAARTTAELPGVTADSAIKQQVAAGTQGGLTPDQQATLAMTATQRAQTAQHNAVTEAQGAQRVAIARQNAAKAATSPAALDDVKETVAGMKDGTVPPILPGRATKEYLATLAEAHRQGYNLQAAVTDWNATQKHISTLNGTQQTRLNQSINALPDLLDSVDTLASQWKGGRFPVLNKANLALAKNGAYGDEVASVARKLDAQIADVTADLGAVYMGGNTPTDQALGLSAKSLSGDWSEKVLHDMVTLARRNVQIRRNSILTSGVAGVSPDNPYAPKQAAPAMPTASASGRLKVKGPNGQTGTVPAGSALPTGWAVVP